MGPLEDGAFAKMLDWFVSIFFRILIAADYFGWFSRSKTDDKKTDK
jgi:hypothetical protein